MSQFAPTSRYHLSRPERLRASESSPRILCQTRIKNEGRWIQKVLDSMATVAHGIVIIDDGSTDNTPEICKAHPAVVEYIWQDHPVQDQVRDKDEALTLALKYDPAWILSLDGDEVLESSAAARIADAIATAPADLSCFEFEFLYMWNDLAHYRVDGPYTKVVHPRLFRVSGSDSSKLKYVGTNYAGNGHCKSVPGGLNGRATELDVKVLHLGYMYKDVREQRYARYRQRDPQQFATGYYEHLLDQPGMILQEWRERPYQSERSASAGPRKQTLKADFYYANVRENLARLVPPTAQRILDVGCGQGALGGYLKSQEQVEVIGIEIQPEVADVAREHLDRVLVGDIEHMTLPYAEGYFDCIILADVLEHLIDPWAALNKLKNYLSPTGIMVISLPNVRNLGVIRTLLEGSWNYQEWGILDSTHLRFFAYNDMLAMFAKAGLTAELAETVRDPLFVDVMKAPPTEPRNLAFGGVVLNQVTPAALNELTAQQFVFIAKAEVESQPARRPTVSIVIPVYNHVELTRQCITSIAAHRGTRSFEIIVADDGSTDGTQEYARALGHAITYCRSDQNRGFAHACNAGAKLATGEYIVFLNNDTIVEPGWLDAMVAALEQDEAIGIVGNLQVFPDTNLVQQAGNVVGADKNYYSIYHRVLTADHPAVNKAREFTFVAGSCLLTRKTLFAELNGFDEGFVNSYEDVDFCLRARALGYKVWYCPQSRIQHLESRTVSGHAKSGPNHERFRQRWSAQLVQDDIHYFTADGMDVQDMLAKHHRSPLAAPAVSPCKQQITESTMNIGILTTWNQPCGIGNYAQQLVAACEAAGLTYTIFAEQASTRIGKDGSNVIRCWTRDQQDIQGTLAAVVQSGVKVLHINHGGMFSLEGWLDDFMYAVRKAGIRIVTTFHATDSLSEILGVRARQSDHCLVHHGQNEMELIGLGGYPQRTTILPLPLQPVRRSDVQEAKLALGLDPAVRIVATVGFLDPHKGVLELIDAVAELTQESPVQLFVLGAAHPHSETGTEYAEQCRQRAQERGISERVRFWSHYIADAELERYLAAADVIVLNYQSQRYEASAALATALASGRPVITSSAPAFETELPCTFKLTAEFNLTTALRLLLTNPFIHRALSESVDYLCAQRSWANAAHMLSAIYEKVLTEPQQPDVDLLKYYATHPDQIYTEPLQRERVRWLKTKTHGRALEVGPANGYVTEFTGATHAIDIYEGRLHVCRALRPGITFEYGDIVKGLKFQDGEFDTVMLPEILEHIDFDEAVVALRECLRVGKQVLITVPSCDKPDYDPDLVHNPEHRWLVTREAVETLLEQAGANGWTIEVSQGLEFYLIAATRAVAARTESEPAAALRRTKQAWVPALRVAVDSAALFEAGTRTRGIGRYFAEQFAALSKANPEWEFTFLGPDAGHVRARVVEDMGIDKFTARVWADVRAEDYDLLYLPHPLGPATIPLLQLAEKHERPVACTFYDLIPLIYPQAYLNPDPRYKQHYRATLGMLKEHCDLFLCISQCTAEDLRRYVGVGLDRLRTIHAGVSDRFSRVAAPVAANAQVQALLAAKEEYVLFVGVPDARKNAGVMLTAVAAARAALGVPLKLVIAGNVPKELEYQLRSAQSQVGLARDALVLTGYVNDHELSLLYQQATATLFPSLYEGFGFPIVEAMMAGCPVIAGNNSSQPEAAGDAALLVDARNPEDVAAAILKLATQPGLRAQLIAAGTVRSKKFTWEKVAAKTSMYLREYVTRHGGTQLHGIAPEHLGVAEMMS